MTKATIGEFAAEFDDLTEPDLRIQNIVATWRIGQELDLKSLAADLPNTEYNPVKYSSIVYDPGEEHPTVLVPRSGKVIMTGTESFPEVEQAFEDFNQRLETLGIEVNSSQSTPEIANIVATVHLDTPLDLNELLMEFGFENTEYEPEQFPALVWDRGDYVILLFSSGSCVINGATTIRELRDAYGDLIASVD